MPNKAAQAHVEFLLRESRVAGHGIVAAVAELKRAAKSATEGGLEARIEARRACNEAKLRLHWA